MLTRSLVFVRSFNNMSFLARFEGQNISLGFTLTEMFLGVTKYVRFKRASTLNLFLVESMETACGVWMEFTQLLNYNFL